jgi:transcriptional regulator with XRE-family HTH domain
MNHTRIEEPGHKLRRIRENLGLVLREVESASQRLAEIRDNDEYYLGISRLSDIENRGVVPNIYKLYSLACIYRQDIKELLSWYGVSAESQVADTMQIGLNRTHTIDFSPALNQLINVPLALEPGVDLRKNQFLSRVVERWGPLPFLVLQAGQNTSLRYAMAGLEDRRMYPIIRPGALLVVDTTLTKVEKSGWDGEHDRPIYFVEHRDGYCFGWVAETEGWITVFGHPSSAEPPVRFHVPSEAEVVGEVVAVANPLASSRRSGTRL